MCLKVRTSDVNFRVALCKLGSAVMRLVLWRDYMVTGEERIIGRVSVCVCVCVCNCVLSGGNISWEALVLVGREVLRV